MSRSLTVTSWSSFVKTGSSVDHDNRARCYIRIAFQCKCMTKSISEKRQLQSATKFLRYSGQIMWAHRSDVATHPVENFYALSSAIFESSSTKVHRITNKVRQKLAPIRESKTVLASGSHTVWIPDSSYWITIFVRRTWILDSTLRERFRRSPGDIPDSQAQDSGFNEQNFGVHKQTFSRFSNKDSLALGEKTVTVT